MLGSTVTRSDITDTLARVMRISRGKASTLLEIALEEMIKGLIKDGELKLSSFGCFHVKQKTQRIGRNPRTGVEVIISPRRTIYFRASHLLKEKITHGNVIANEQKRRVAGS
jgi:integration host factor subunit alpha